MGVRRISVTGMLVNAMLLFSIISVIRGIAAFEHINKIWIGFLAVMLLLRLLYYRYTPGQVVMLYLTILIHGIALCFTDFPLYHTNILFYFLLWVLIFLFFAKSKNQILTFLRGNDRFIRIVLWLWTILVGISAFLPSGYDGRYFISFAGSSFRLMPVVLIVTAMAMYMSVSRKDRRYEFFLILPTYGAFMNSARTYFVIYILFLLMYVYMRTKSKRKFYILLIPMVAVILLVMSVSGIMDKFQATQYTAASHMDFWGTISSGRTVFWKWDLEAFFDLPIWKQFVGNGFNFAYDATASRGTAIWAHNDIIQLLMNFGYLGVVIYLWAYHQLIRVYLPRGMGIPAAVRVLFHSAVWFNSMVNMSYTYIAAVIAYPLFLCAIDENYRKNDSKKAVQ